MNANELYPMSHKRRDLYQRLVNDERNFKPITDRLYFIAEHFPENKIDAALTWLVSNNLVGHRFVAWFKSECDASDLQMHANLLRAADNQKMAPIIAGKNFRL